MRALKYQIELDSNHLQIICNGDFEVSGIIDALEDAFNQIDVGRTKGIVLDVQNLGGTPPNRDQRLLLSRHVSKLQWLLSDPPRFALVGDTKMIDSGGFDDLIFENLGGLMKVFNDIQEAVSWAEH